MKTIPVLQGDPFWRSCVVEVQWRVFQEEERSPLRGNFTLLSDDLYPLDHVLGALSAIGYVLSGTMSWFYSHWSLFSLYCITPSRVIITIHDGREFLLLLDT